MPRSVVKITLHEPKEILCSSAAALMVSLQSAPTKSLSFTVTSSLLDEELPNVSSLSATDLRCSPTFNAADPLKKSRTTRCFLSKGGFNLLISFSSRFVEVCV